MLDVWELLSDLRCWESLHFIKCLWGDRDMGTIGQNLDYTPPEFGKFVSVFTFRIIYFFSAQMGTFFESIVCCVSVVLISPFWWCWVMSNFSKRGANKQISVVFLFPRQRDCTIFCRVLGTQILWRPELASLWSRAVPFFGVTLIGHILAAWHRSKPAVLPDFGFRVLLLQVFQKKDLTGTGFMRPESGLDRIEV